MFHDNLQAKVANFDMTPFRESLSFDFQKIIQGDGIFFILNLMDLLLTLNKFKTKDGKTVSDGSEIADFCEANFKDQFTKLGQNFSEDQQEILLKFIYNLSSYRSQKIPYSTDPIEKKLEAISSDSDGDSIMKEQETRTLSMLFSLSFPISQHLFYWIFGEKDVDDDSVDKKEKDYESFKFVAYFVDSIIGDQGLEELNEVYPLQLCNRYREFLKAVTLLGKLVEVLNKNEYNGLDLNKVCYTDQNGQKHTYQELFDIADSVIQSIFDNSFIWHHPTLLQPCLHYVNQLISASSYRPNFEKWKDEKAKQHMIMKELEGITIELTITKKYRLTDVYSPPKKTYQARLDEIAKDIYGGKVRDMDQLSLANNAGNYFQKLNKELQYEPQFISEELKNKARHKAYLNQSDLVSDKNIALEMRAKERYNNVLQDSRQSDFSLNLNKENWEDNRKQLDLIIQYSASKFFHSRVNKKALKDAQENLAKKDLIEIINLLEKNYTARSIFKIFLPDIHQKICRFFGIDEHDTDTHKKLRELKAKIVEETPVYQQRQLSSKQPY